MRDDRNPMSPRGAGLPPPTRARATAPFWRLGVLGRSMAHDILRRAILGVIALSLPIVLISLDASIPLFALSPWRLLQVAASMAAVILLNTIPIIAAVMILWSYARFLSDSVIVSMFSAGRSCAAVAMPGLVVAALLALVTAALSLAAVPAANRKVHDTLQFLRRNMDFSMLEPNRFYDFRHERITFYFTGRNASGRLLGVFINKKLPPDEQGVVRDETYFAREAQVIGVEGDRALLMTQGGALLPRADGQGIDRIGFDEMIWRPNGSGASAERTTLHYDEAPTSRILAGAPPDDASATARRQWLREIVKRLFYPLLTLSHALFALGLVLAFTTPTGRGRGAGLAVALAAMATMGLHGLFVFMAEATALIGPLMAALFLALLALETGLGLWFIANGQKPDFQALFTRLGALKPLSCLARAIAGRKALSNKSAGTP